MRDELIDAIDALLPQTQCGKCGHGGCRPYAEGIAAGEAINKCPPGGERTLARLAALTGQSPLPLAQPAESPQVAVIREPECIGCTKCIQACPVDAILGAAKQMHTVIADECTGCELCVAPCPVDCIDILPHPGWQQADTRAEQDAFLERRARLGRQRFEARQQRLARQARERREAREKRRAAAGTKADSPAETRRLKATRAALQAGLRRLERKRRAPELDADERQRLDVQHRQQRAQLDAIEAQLNSPNSAATPRPSGNAQRRQRLAAQAAHQALRRARAQLAHAQRNRDAALEVEARRHIDEANAMLEAAGADHQEPTRPETP